MAGGTDRLSDVRVRAFMKGVLRGTASTKKLADGGGLYITITPAGTAVWRVKYRIGGLERLFSPGPYPSVSLAEARTARDEVRKLLRDGRDPVVARRERRAQGTIRGAHTFTQAAEHWLTRRKVGWSAIHYDTSKRAIERDVLPHLGSLPMTSITTPMITRVIEKIVRRGSNETAGKILFNVRRIFALAATTNPAVDANVADPVKEVLFQSKAYAPRPALLDWKGLGDLMRNAEVAPLSPSVRMAHRLVAFTAQRIKNIVEATWDQFDLDRDVPCWTIPRSLMKVKQGRHHDQKVLLGPTITGELRTWRAMTGGTGYVFPSPMGNAHITREALEKCYRVTLQLANTHSVHGWRASLSTLARDAGFSRDVVELTLDHVNDNAVARAYDRGERLTERVELMFWWNANLLAAQQGAAVIPHRVKGAASVR